MNEIINLESKEIILESTKVRFKDYKFIYFSFQVELYRYSYHWNTALVPFSVQLAELCELC